MTALLWSDSQVDLPLVPVPVPMIILWGVFPGLALALAATSTAWMWEERATRRLGTIEAMWLGLVCGTNGALGVSTTGAGAVSLVVTWLMLVFGLTALGLAVLEQRAWVVPVVLVSVVAYEMGQPASLLPMGMLDHAGELSCLGAGLLVVGLLLRNARTRSRSGRRAHTDALF